MAKMKLEWDFHELTDFGKRLNDLPKFEQYAQQIAKELAKALHEALFRNTPVKTGNLCAAWGGSENYSYTIKQFGYGYKITLKNNGANDKNFRYGLAVNDGHWSYNQYGGPYKWVQGSFFVEKSVLQTANSMQVEQLIMQHLQKWWDSV